MNEGANENLFLDCFVGINMEHGYIFGFGTFLFSERSARFTRIIYVLSFSVSLPSFTGI